MEVTRKKRTGSDDNFHASSMQTWPLVATLGLATPVETPPAVAIITLTAIAVVLGVAVLIGASLGIAYRLRWIGAERKVRLGRRLRVGFGAAFLLAALSPYVALNFSMTTLIPFVAGAGVLVAMWVWSNSRSDFDAPADGV